MDVLRFVPGVRPPPLPTFAAPVSAPAPHAAAASPAPGFHSPLLGLWPRRSSGENALGAAASEAAAAGVVEAARDHRRRRRAEDGGNWVLQILRVQSSSPPPSPPRDDEGPPGSGSGEEGGGSSSSSQRCAGRCGAGPDTDSEEGACSVADDDAAEELDRAAFSRLLRKVSLSEAKLYSRMSGLCNFAYMVPRIKPRYLQKYNMIFVTSSVEERAKLPNPSSQEDQNPSGTKKENIGTLSKHSNVQESTYGAASEHERMQDHQGGQGINPLAAYRIAASAASYVQSRAMELWPQQIQ